MCLVLVIVSLFGVIAAVIVYITGMEILFIIYAGISAVVMAVVKIKNCIHSCLVCTTLMFVI